LAFMLHSPISIPAASPLPRWSRPRWFLHIIVSALFSPLYSFFLTQSHLQPRLEEGDVEVEPMNHPGKRIPLKGN